MGRGEVGNLWKVHCSSVGGERLGTSTAGVCRESLKEAVVVIQA